MAIKLIFVVIICGLYPLLGHANGFQTSIVRMNADVAAGKPLVAHVVVALCDNKYQGIVPVPASIGDGDIPRTNLYWGAGFGVKSFFQRAPGWKSVPVAPSRDERILERVVFKRTIVRNGKAVVVYVIADAWRGREIKSAIEQFLQMANGYGSQTLVIDNTEIPTGAGAHLIAYVGHNGLMDFEPPDINKNKEDKLSRSTIVLACKSQKYFSNLMPDSASPLLYTRSLMAPEAYSLEAAISRWFEGGNARESVMFAAKAYAQYQKISESSARTVFVFPKQ